MGLKIKVKTPAQLDIFLLISPYFVGVSSQLMKIDALALHGVDVETGNPSWHEICGLSRGAKPISPDIWYMVYGILYHHLIKSGSGCDGTISGKVVLVIIVPSMKKDLNRVYQLIHEIEEKYYSLVTGTRCKPLISCITRLNPVAAL